MNSALALCERSHSARGIAMVDSPVGKTSEHAVTGTLTLMIGGDAADIERVRPVLACMGNQFFICGGQGISDAYYCKECVQMEKDRDGCPKIVNLGSAKTDLWYERKKYGFKKR